LNKCLELHFQDQELISNGFSGEITIVETMQPDLDPRPHRSVVAECAHEFLLGPFGAPSFLPELFDNDSLLLCRR
jgi:hypothetical protein